MAEQQIQIGSRVITLLNAATSTGAGTAADLDFVRGTFTMATVVTGAPSAVSVTLQGSLDGVTFQTLATSTSTTGDQQWQVDKPQRYLRANLATLTGGTSPTVTVRAAAI